MKFSKITIISGDPVLSESVSGHFRRSNEYLPLFDVPSKLPSQESQLLGFIKNECTHICNAINLIQPKFVVVLNCHDEIIKTIQDQISNEKIKLFKEYDLKSISNLPGFRDKGHSPQIINKNNDDNFEGNLIAVDSVEKELPLVIASNLATALKAKIIKLPPANLKDVHWFQDRFPSWMNADNDIERDIIKQSIIDKLNGQIDPNDYKLVRSISFITRGVPYGFLPFNCPTTHFYHHRLLGNQIISGMIKSDHPHLKSSSVYISDPDEFDNSESEKLRKIFKTKKMVIKSAVGQAATARDAYYSTEYLPVDLIYYTTHCGETKGMRVKEKFILPDGGEHIVCFDEVISFIPEKKFDQIQVQHYKRWISIDGINWTDDEGKKKIGAGDLIQKYVKQLNDKTPEELRESRIDAQDIGIIKGSDTLKMFDFNYNPMLHQVGGHRYPVVFNNACSTWRELAIRFAMAGSSNYIGTSVDISNYLAVMIAIKFSELFLKGRSIGFALYNSQKKFIVENAYTPYLMHGFLFSKFNSIVPFQKTGQKFFDNLVSELSGWETYKQKVNNNKMIKNTDFTINFLKEEINNYLQRNKPRKKEMTQ